MPQLPRAPRIAASAAWRAHDVQPRLMQAAQLVRDGRRRQGQVGARIAVRHGEDVDAVQLRAACCTKSQPATRARRSLDAVEVLNGHGMGAIPRKHWAQAVDGCARCGTCAGGVRRCDPFDRGGVAIPPVRASAGRSDSTIRDHMSTPQFIYVMKGLRKVVPRTARS
jgi:hypothetical protein